MERALAYARGHRDEALGDLSQLVRRISISTRGEGIGPCADMTRARIAAAGLTVDLHDVPGGHPVLVGTHRTGARRSLLFYNHYDVQPPEPTEEWTHEPFGGKVADGRLWGRGSSDMKGALVGRLWAIRSWLEAEGRLPVDVVFLVEGEEEIGSEHLDGFVAAHPDLLRADACVWESGGITDGEAEILCGCKGVLVVELTCSEGTKDLHSASAATLEAAPWRLVHALSTLRDDATGRCTIDGYTDSVRPPSSADLDLCAKLGAPERLQEDLAAMGRDRWHRSLREGRDVVVAGCFLPTCNIQGMDAGYTGLGMKNVLPHEAHAKLDLRLVADQTTVDALDKLESHLARRGYGDIEVRVLARVEPSRSDPNDPLVHAMSRAARETYGKEPLVSPSMGGFGPMHTIAGRLGIATVGGGDYQRPGGGAHAPDEHIWLDDFISGIEATIRLLQAYADT